MGTGSTGNSYYIKANNDEILLLDVGLPIADIKKGINYEVDKVKR